MRSEQSKLEIYPFFGEWELQVYPILPNNLTSLWFDLSLPVESENHALLRPGNMILTMSS